MPFDQPIIGINQSLDRIILSQSGIFQNQKKCCSLKEEGRKYVRQAINNVHNSDPTGAWTRCVSYQWPHSFPYTMLFLIWKNFSQVNEKMVGPIVK